ncbi:hypothetical protein JOQ06_029896 [Pogonophryne albipinna]|uniref:Uncharacterized protein n=1 Tax=Pogonophryne albipinna TaxID=1090488 RepID=A0AAD6FFC7_9TELE|nr:hypothetical protein JOQ06_029896 [Pogonophryne albipinna]
MVKMEKNGKKSRDRGRVTDIPPTPAAPAMILLAPPHPSFSVVSPEETGEQMRSSRQEAVLPPNATW